MCPARRLTSPLQAHARRTNRFRNRSTPRKLRHSHRNPENHRKTTRSNTWERMAHNMRTYRVTVTREESDWLGQCAEYPEAVDFAPTLKKLCKGMVDAIVLAADLPSGAKFNIQLEAGEGLSPELNVAFAIANRRLELRAEQARLQEATLHSIHVCGRKGTLRGTLRRLSALLRGV